MNLIMDLSTKDSGVKRVCVRVEESKCGKILLNLKAIGKMIWLMVEVG